MIYTKHKQTNKGALTMTNLEFRDFCDKWDCRKKNQKEEIEIDVLQFVIDGAGFFLGMFMITFLYLFF